MTSPNEVHFIIGQAFEALQQGDFAKAQTLLGPYRELDFNIRDFHLVLGLSLGTENLAQTRAHMNLELERYPDNLVAKNLLDSLNQTLHIPSTKIENENADTSFPKISIVTPSFNQKALLTRCIDSILSQDYPNLEYIIIDGGSTDGSLDVIKEVEDKVSYWHSRPDDGPYAAVNEGLKMTTGDIMGWLNSDDLLFPKGLYRLAEVFSNNQEINFLTGKFQTFDEFGNTKIHGNPYRLWCRDYLLDENTFMKPAPLIMQEGTYWRRKLWEQAGSTLDLSLKYAADFELWLRFMRHEPLYTVRGLIGGFRSHSDQQRSRLFWDEYVSEGEKVIEREKNIELAPQEYHSIPPALVEDPLDPRRETSQPKEYPLASTYAVPTNPTYPRFSIISELYNNEIFLEEHIVSILSQHWPNLDLRIVDMGSSDTTHAILSKYKDFLTLVSRSPNESRTQALERAFKESNGIYMCFLRASDRMAQMALPQAAQVFLDNPTVELINGRTYAWNFPNEQAWINRTFDVLCRRNLLAGNFYDPYIQTEGLIWKKSLWEKAGGHLDSNYEHAIDLEMLLRFTRHVPIQEVSVLFGGAYIESPGRWQDCAIPYIREAQSLVLREKNSPPTIFDQSLPPLPLM